MPGPVLLRKFLRSNKNDKLVDQAELIDVNPTFANIRYPDGRESLVSLQDLAPLPSNFEEQITHVHEDVDALGLAESPGLQQADSSSHADNSGSDKSVHENMPIFQSQSYVPEEPISFSVRRSTRLCKLPSKFDDYVLSR